MRRGHAHARQVQQRGRGAKDPDGEEFAPDNFRPAGRADEQGLHGAALLLARTEVDRRIQGSRQRPHNQQKRKNPHQQLEHPFGGQFVARLDAGLIQHVERLIKIAWQAAPHQPDGAEIVFPMGQYGQQPLGG